MKKISLLIIILFLFSCNESNPLLPESDETEEGITIVDYGIGAPCGGAIMNFDGDVYRTYDGGVAPLSADLQISATGKLGDYNSEGTVYHAEVINGNIWFAITDYSSFNEVRVVNNSGLEIASYEVGINPGDFASWGSWVFVANEGNYGASNGSISVIDDMGNISHITSIGDVVQSIEIYNNKLIVLINNSHMIKIYDITDQGLALPGIEISTEGSSPREMVVVDNKVYFTNWNSKDIKVLNLFNYQIENSVALDGLPEDIISDGNSLWVSIPNLSLYDANLGSAVIKIDIETLDIIEAYEVGLGPEALTMLDGDIYIARKTYSPDWYNTYFGSSRINN